jgi:hypothetical protein
LEHDVKNAPPTPPSPHPNAPPDPQPGPNVSITVDGKTVPIHRGHQPVSAIKTAGGVPAAYELAQQVDGKLVPLPDDGAVTIKGGEAFVSYPRGGTSA